MSKQKCSKEDFIAPPTQTEMTQWADQLREYATTIRDCVIIEGLSKEEKEKQVDILLKAADRLEDGKYHKVLDPDNWREWIRSGKKEFGERSYDNI